MRSCEILPGPRTRFRRHWTTRWLVVLAAGWSGACGLILDPGPPRGVQPDAGLDGATPCDDTRLTRCDAVCVDLEIDDHFCGSCSHDCGLGMCDAGVCQPAWVDVAAGQEHSCALSSDGNVFCWGVADARSGSTGGTTEGAVRRIEGLPGSAVQLPRSDSLALGDVFGCLLSPAGATGDVRCWGKVESEVVSLTTPSAKIVNFSDAKPIAATRIASGSNFVCALDETKSPVTLSCWGTRFADGSCDSGNCIPLLGPGSSSAQPGVAVPFGTGSLNSAGALDLGRDYGCLSGVFDNGAGTYCWGSGYGKNTGLDGTLPTLDLAKAFETSDSRVFQQLATTNLFACGLFNGQVSCWGGSEVVASHEGTSLTHPSLYPRQDSAQPYLPSPVVSAGAYELAAGDWHACAAVEDGADSKILCWGIVPPPQREGTAIRLVATPSPTAVTMSGVTDRLRFRVTDLAAGRFHTCALFANHDLVCWGSNLRGQLGEPATTGLTDERTVVLCSPTDYANNRCR